MFKSKYISAVESILNKLGFSGIWLKQEKIDMSFTSFKAQVKQRLQDQYVQNWQSDIDNNEPYYNYRLLKDAFVFENHLKILPEVFAKIMIKFRTLNHKLPIQKGRMLGIERKERMCHKCQMKELGDEFP